MNSVLKVVITMFLIAGLFGCGTLQLNHIVTGTECATREDCIKDLHLDNPANPDITFVIEPLLMNEKEKAMAGNPGLFSPVWHGNVELCVAQALRAEFPKASILFEPNKINTGQVHIKLNRIISQAALSGTYMKLDYDIIVNSAIISQSATTATGAFWHLSNTQIAREKYTEVCHILAKEVRNILLSKEMKVQ